jgi:hypothetical protein
MLARAHTHTHIHTQGIVASLMDNTARVLKAKEELGKLG